MSSTNTSDVIGKAPGGRKLIAVVHMDMVGYSRLIGLDDAGTLSRIRTLRHTLIDPAVDEHGGRIAQTAGDSLLIVFDSIEGAVRCAVEVQQHVPTYDGDQPSDRRIRFRVGVNIGDVIAEGADLHGEGVNVAVRLQSECPPGGICASRAVRDHMREQLDLAFEELGPLNLKNIARPVEAFLLRLGAEAPKATRPATSMMELSIAKAPRFSLVVLPFDNLGGNPDEDYLADTITEDLTTDLSRWPGALVIARHSAAAYKGRPIDVRQIGEELGVRYVVEGSIRKLGEMLRVNVQLVSAETKAHLWAERFDQNMADLGRGQEVIVSRLQAALGVHIQDAESARSLRERPNNPDAFDLLLRARSMIRKHDHPELLQETIGWVEQALRLDPSSVPAMCSLANALINRAVNISDDQGNEDLIEQATAIVATATTIEPNNEEVIHCQGYLFRALGRWAEAIAILERLLELSPSHVSGHRQLGFCKLAVGQPDAAIPLLQRSIRLDPLTPFNRYAYRRIGWSLLLLGHDADSIQWQQRALAADAMAPALERGNSYLLMAAAHALIGQSDYAHRTLIEGNRLRPFVTVRTFLDRISQRGLLDSAHVSQMGRVQEGLRVAGLRDHSDEDADFGVKPDAALHQGPFGLTPTTVLVRRPFALASLSISWRTIDRYCSTLLWIVAGDRYRARSDCRGPAMEPASPTASRAVSVARYRT
ncbi:MAG TPA: tetratricopeptide repeat protein [Acetobacteraceae bacterium]|nr:tetratricopeptide repeat protein [Acetobacteraceae bacterium]